MQIVTDQIVKFRNFLIASWPQLSLLMTDHDWDNDPYFIAEWLEVNWELLVERQLLKEIGSLSPFGFYLSKILNSTLPITHEIHCTAKKDQILIDDKTKEPISKNIPLKLRLFLKKMPPTYGLYPPFDYVDVICGNQIFYVPFDDVDFILVPIKNLKIEHIM